MSSAPTTNSTWLTTNSITTGTYITGSPTITIDPSYVVYKKPRRVRQPKSKTSLPTFTQRLEATLTKKLGHNVSRIIKSVTRTAGPPQVEQDTGLQEIYTFNRTYQQSSIIDPNGQTITHQIWFHLDLFVDNNKILTKFTLKVEHLLR